MSIGTRRSKYGTGTRASSRAPPSAHCSTTASAACRPTPAMRTLTSSTALDEVRARARSLGFDAFGITTPDVRSDLRAKLDQALAAGWHGDMNWMAETAGRRAD